MVAKSYFSGCALLFMSTVILAAVPAGTARAQTAAIGKLFTSTGTCSASVISGKNIIVTAAHCCWNRSNNSWIGGWSFAPGYNNGNAPYGVFNWADARVPQRRHPFRRLPDQAAKRRLRPSRDLLHGLARAFVELSACAKHERVRLSGQHRRRQQSRKLRSAKLGSACELRIGRPEHGLQHDLRLERRSLDQGPWLRESRRFDGARL